MIDLTPLEVRKKKGDFRKALRGYEPALVDDFLDIVADRLEQLVRENTALTERVARLEQQVADYRDRERALTDALVTAQEMREEIREQTTREADLLKRSTQQQAETQLREAQQQAEQTLREAVQTAEDRTRKAQQESERLVRTAQQDAERTLRVAEQQASQLRTEAIRAREQEEELLRRLRARQQQLLTSYRTFLERELSELVVITESLELGKEGGVPAVAIEPAPATPVVPSAADTLRGVAAPARSPEPDPLAGLTLVPADGASHTGQPPVRPAAPRPEPEPAAAPEAAAAEPEPLPLLDGPLPFEPEEPEPFEPEPVYEEDLEPRGVRVEPSALLQEQPEVAEESGEPVPAGWESEPAQLDLEVESMEEEDEEDAATAALLENAAKAGYRFDLQDDELGGEELLLEEPAEEGEQAEDEEPGDDDWLSSVIEERK